jgi:hypothetical protein
LLDQLGKHIDLKEGNERHRRGASPIKREPHGPGLAGRVEVRQAPLVSDNPAAEKGIIVYRPVQHQITHRVDQRHQLLVAIETSRTGNIDIGTGHEAQK